MSAVQRVLVSATLAALAVLVVLVVGPQGVAMAAGPTVTITSPSSGSSTNNQEPVFSGTAEDIVDPVTLKIYEGVGTGGTLLQAPESSPVGGTWGAQATTLVPGTYTAVAEQLDAETLETGFSAEVTFTVDTTPPMVSMNPVVSPANDATPTLTGGAGVAVGDEPLVSVTIYKGGSVGGSIAASESITPSGGEWSYTALHLADGTYTAQASQSDEAGNIGTSIPLTFTIDTIPPGVSMHVMASPTNDSTPTLTGGAGVEVGDDQTVAVTIYEGVSVGGSVAASESVTPSGGAWSYTAPQLADGTYTAQASQSDDAGNTGTSALVTFTIDTTPPKVTLTSPAHGSSASGSSQAVSGSAGTAEGDQPAITIQLFAGSTTTGQALEAITVQASKGGWSATFGGLSPGTYTARAEQRDDAGNVGDSAPVTFTLTAPVVVTPPTPPTQPETPPTQPATTPEQSPQPATTPTQPVPATPPTASFQWFPTAPHTGERISLVSTSTDASSPIAGFAWSLAGGGAFNAGAPAITASFAAPGDHVVQLRVTGANGLTSVATERIPVTSPVLTLMQPFPVVRIAGSEGASGVKIGLLTVQAPVGATVDVTCHGPGCPAKAEDVVAASRRGKSTAGVALIAFRRFERSMWAGAILEIRVSERGQIGKYTSFAVRRGRLPARVDTCLNPAGIEPIVCPSS